MRKHDKLHEAKKKRFILIMGAIIILLMVFSFFEYAIYRQSSEQRLEGKPISFNQATQLYELKDKDTLYQFYFLPGELRVNVTGDPTSILKDAQVIVFTFDPEGGSLPIIEQLGFELATHLPQSTRAVTKNITPYTGFPVWSCADARPYVPVVYFKIEAAPSIRVEGNCVILAANNTDFFRVRDALLYDKLGITQNSTLQ